MPCALRTAASIALSYHRTPRSWSLTISTFCSASIFARAKWWHAFCLANDVLICSVRQRQRVVMADKTEHERELRGLRALAMGLHWATDGGTCGGWIPTPICGVRGNETCVTIDDLLGTNEKKLDCCCACPSCHKMVNFSGHANKLNCVHKLLRAE